MRISFAIIIILSIVSCTPKKNTEKPIAHTFETLDSLLEKHPDSIPLLMEYAGMLMKDYHGDYALPYAAKAFRLDTTNIEARAMYASALVNRIKRNVNELEIAEQHLLYVIGKQPGNKSAMVDLANAYTAMGDYEKSFKYANEALKVDKKYRDAYVVKGLNYRALGNTKLAKSSFETAVQQDPAFFMGYLQLGWLYTEDEEYDLARNYFITAKQLEPTSTDAIYGVAYSLQQTGKSEDALAEYRHLLQTDTTFYLAPFNQGYIKQYNQKQIDSAIYYYKVAIEMQPEFVKGWHQLGTCYLDKGNKETAYTAFKKALEYNPDFEPTQIAIMKCR